MIIAAFNLPLKRYLNYITKIYLSQVLLHSHCMYFIFYWDFFFKNYDIYLLIGNYINWRRTIFILDILIIFRFCRYNHDSNLKREHATLALPISSQGTRRVGNFNDFLKCNSNSVGNLCGRLIKLSFH